MLFLPYPLWAFSFFILITERFLLTYQGNANSKLSQLKKTLTLFRIPSCIFARRIKRRSLVLITVIVLFMRQLWSLKSCDYAWWIANFQKIYIPTIFCIVIPYIYYVRQNNKPISPWKCIPTSSNNVTINSSHTLIIIKNCWHSLVIIQTSSATTRPTLS